MHGKSYIRMKSSLSGKRVKTSPEFRSTMAYAGILGRASRVASVIYQALPKDFREGWMYRAFTGEAIQWLKKGKADAAVKEILWKTYVEVWEFKEAEKLQDQACDIVVQNPVQSVITIQPKTCIRSIDSFFSIPWKRNTVRIKPGDTGRRVLRRSAPESFS
jgi:hypothetical protein